MSKFERKRALTLGQHLTIVGSRMFFGALTSAITFARGVQSDGWRTMRYGLLRDETLDHMEARGEIERAPVIFFHGGGWMMGTPQTYHHDLQFLADAGHPVFNVDYPKAPEHMHPTLLQSVFKALMFIRANFPEAKTVHLMGDSAGGNLAVMAALLLANPELMDAIDPHLKTSSKLPKALSVTSIYGVLDRHSCLNSAYPGGDVMLESYAGPGALLDEVDAEHAITPMDLKFNNHPPCLLVCGSNDPLRESHAVYERRLQNAGHAVTSHTYGGGIHGFFNFPDSAPKAACRRDILAFLDSL